MELPDELLFDPDIIAHFTTIDTAVTKILYSGKIRFGSYRSSKDALESSRLVPMWGGTVSREESKDEYELKVRLASESQSLAIGRLDNLRIGCFCQNAERTTTLDDVGAMRPRMWSQYGDSHRGACLLISRRLFVDAVKDLYPHSIAEPVKYRSFKEMTDGYVRGDYDKMKALGKTAYESHLFQKLVDDIVMVKHLDFLTESEFRIIFEDDPSSESLVEINPFLRGILVSKEIDPFFANQVETFGKTLGIPTGSIDWSLRKPIIL